MVDPFIALVVALSSLALAAWAVWPRHGLLARWRRVRRRTSRVLIEDALKQLFKAEIREQHLTVEGIAGAMEVSLDRAAAVLDDMSRHGLATWEEGRPALTATGRAHAAHIVRAHRLWERYLADETGFDAADWHGLADAAEHRFSPERLGRLAARLGHPRHDPHGDPIPTRDGHVVPHGGRPLTTLGAQEAGRIVHVEDEPPTVFAQLVAEGLVPGMTVRVLDRSPDRITLWADGDVHVLAPMVADNVSVVAVPASEVPEEASEGVPAVRLVDLRRGERGRVVRLVRACRGAERRRLLDLGLTPGTVVTPELASAGRGPTAYYVRGGLVALRAEQARMIHVERLEAEISANGTKV